MLRCEIYDGLQPDAPIQVPMQIDEGKGRIDR